MDSEGSLKRLSRLTFGGGGAGSSSENTGLEKSTQPATPQAATAARPRRRIRRSSITLEM
jgi:hypothetical protein